MWSDKFTLLELLDLSLRVPEVGAVNFNILHAALTHIAVTLGIGQQRPQCYFEDETAAQLAVTRGRLADPHIKRRQSLRPTTTAQGIKDMVKDVLRTEAKTEKPESGSEEDVKSESLSEDESEVEDKSESGTEEDDEPDNVTEDEAEVEESEAASDAEVIEATPDDEQPTDEELEVNTEGQTDDQVQSDSHGKADNRLEGLTEQDIFEADPARVIQDMWRAININRRVDGAEKGLHELTTIVDLLVDKFKELETESGEVVDRTKKLRDALDNSVNKIQKLETDVSNLTSRIDDSNELTKNEIQRLEVAFKEDLGAVKEDISTNVNNINKRMEELHGLITPKEDFTELVSRVDTLEVNKVNREELGRLMEEGFIDKFIKEQGNLRSELDTLKDGVSEVDGNLKALITRIDEEILKYIDDSFADTNNNIAAMKEKLDTLDADDINDTFVRLEEEAEKIAKELETLKVAESRFEKEARVNFKKISDLSDLLDRLEATKVDKSKMYELLELKADLELVMNKLDRSEFVSVMQDVEEKVERLTINVKITEEKLEDGLSSVRRVLSFKMYTEDFVIATEPIRNRIKAMIYEQEKIKELVLKSFLPDAPGVVKCFSCKRAANLTGKKYQGKHKSSQNESPDETLGTSQTKSERIKLPPINLDKVPIPPADKPRIQDIHQLPVLFATARPHVGLAHQKRKRDIDRELSAYFSGGGKSMKAIGGGHTKTFPQQRGLSFTTRTLSEGKRCEVLLKGVDNRIYRGAVPNMPQPDLPGEHEAESSEEGNDDAEEPTRNTKEMVYPTPVTLHRKSAPVPSKSVIFVPSSN